MVDVKQAMDGTFMVLADGYRSVAAGLSLDEAKTEAHKWLDALCDGLGKLNAHKECRKPVDLSVLIDSGIDVENEFGGMDTPCSSGFSIFELEERHWTPRMNYWFSCLNFDSPSTLIDELDRAGFEVQGDFKDNFIITGLQDGYDWPWEVDE